MISRLHVQCRGKLDIQSGNTKEVAVLVLSRKKNESIIINDNITVMVVDIRGDKVRLGISADPSISVHREEVHQAIQRDRAAADALSSQTHDADSES